jgi:hypothetical protein
MIIHWTPCVDNPPARWSQPEPDVLRCEWRGRDIEVDFTDATIVEYKIPAEARDVIHKAWREDGTLHVTCPSLRQMSEDTTEDWPCESKQPAEHESR